MEVLQHVLVTAAALGAATFVFRRVFSTFKPMKGASQCGSCEAPRRRGPADGASTTPVIQISNAGGTRVRPAAKGLRVD